MTSFLIPHTHTVHIKLISFIFVTFLNGNNSFFHSFDLACYLLLRNAANIKERYISLCRPLKK